MLLNLPSQILLNLIEHPKYLRHDGLKLTTSDATNGNSLIFTYLITF